jgi:YfiH family protein
VSTAPLTEDHVAVDLPGATALFTTRRGGVSIGPYASLNLGRFTDDAPDAVQQNRKGIQDRLGIRFAYGRQVHGRAVLFHREPPPADGYAAADSDGQATTLPGVAPMVLTADCVPIALAGHGAVAMLHAGWRGLAANIVAEGVRTLRDLGAGGPLSAAIGPGAGPCCYEVSDDVRDAFAIYGPDVSRGRNLDLKAVARAQLRAAGVDAITDVELCTICSDPALFFSHRRDHGVTGRQAGIVWLS